ncbi:hypothetical protein KAFR_0K01980 [Kazachstania africana CBS 2517]|uniref:RING-type domain-containing protein n=1 Tax=Kazachstania africana (strain ATCC 22294 / BCRC 22015 / CBS 2517 / CECT 1963 / NBRC 1671 / NRRL Y-8276) TaxID=1071382 RepID=H2B1Q2_KAZAF|nr:hypothetical protein KAFR_0K01980 [Kazachstania africana CBS 2517]CCF60552.1 hypothetical protein KAFR_0K01980 [Kazachstania africana CBS 2517]
MTDTPPHVNSDTDSPIEVERHKRRRVDVSDSLHAQSRDPRVVPTTATPLVRDEDSNDEENYTITNVSSSIADGNNETSSENESDESIEVLGERTADVSDDDFGSNNALECNNDEGNEPRHTPINFDELEEFFQPEASGPINADVADTIRSSTEGSVTDIAPTHSISLDVNEVEQSIGPSSEQEETIGPIDLDAEAAEQQVIEIPDEEVMSNKESSETPIMYKAARDYRCPICFDPPEVAMMTPCGHVFCCDCLFQMVNSSRTYRKLGHCALCRKDVRLHDIRMLILKKKRIKK